MRQGRNEFDSVGRDVEWIAAWLFTHSPQGVFSFKDGCDATCFKKWTRRVTSGFTLLTNFFVQTEEGVAGQRARGVKRHQQLTPCRHEELTPGC